MTVRRSPVVVPCYVQLEPSVTIIDNTFYYFSQKRSFLWFVSEIEEMLICVFHGCNKSHVHKLIDMLATYDFNVPICPSGPIYLTPSCTLSYLR